MQSDNHFFFPHFSVKDPILHADFLFVLIIIKSDHISKRANSQGQADKDENYNMLI